MADWEQLRELTHQVAPPDYESLVSTARRRTHRARAALGVLASIVLIGGGIGIAAISGRDDSDPAQPIEQPTEKVGLPDGVQALPGPDAGRDFASLDAGRYRVPLTDTLAFDVDVADRTSAHDDGIFLSTGRIVIKTEIAGDEYGVPQDPCTSHYINPVGRTVDDLVRALTDLAPYEVSRPRPVELGGAQGTYLEARIPSAYDASQCDGGDVQLPGNPTTTVSAKPPYVGRWWILDVDGRRVVIQQNCWKCTFDQLVNARSKPESITFAPAD